MPLNQQVKQANIVQAPQFDNSGASVAANTVSKVAQMQQPLLQRLSQTSGRLVEQGTQKMLNTAKKKAVVDVEEGHFDEVGLTKGYSLYDQAYDDAAETAYISTTNADIQANVQRIAAINKYNPDGFKKAWESYSNTTAKTSRKVSPYVEAVTKDAGDQLAAGAYAKITSNLVTAQYNLQKKDNESALALYEQEFINAKLGGNEEAAATALIHRNKTMQIMKQYMQITDTGIEVSNKLLNKKVVTAQVKQVFSQQMQDGTAPEYITNFRKLAKENPAFSQFSPTEIQGMIDDMYKTIKGENEYESSMEKNADLHKKQVHDEVTQTMDEAWLVGTLTQDDVDTALHSDTISQAEYKAYSLKVHDTGAKFTNTATELKVVSNMASLTTQDIMSLPDMTNADKAKYIKQLRTYKNSAEGKWTSTVKGKASLELLKNHWNIVGAGMLSDLTKPKDIEEYGQVYQAFIREMENLPPELRETRSMEYAQAALDSFKAHKIAINDMKAKEAAKTKQENIQKLEQRIQAHERVIGKQKTQSYLRGLATFRESFGKTADIKFDNIWSK